jgi:hypothetical protein
MYCLKITLPLNNVVTSSTAKCSDGLKFSVGVTEHIKETDCFPQSIIIFVSRVEISIYEKLVMFHHFTVKWHTELFRSGHVVFQYVLLVMFHLYDMSQTYIRLLNLSFILCYFGKFSNGDIFVQIYNLH